MGRIRNRRLVDLDGPLDVVERACDKLIASVEKLQADRMLPAGQSVNIIRLPGSERPLDLPVDGQAHLVAVVRKNAVGDIEIEQHRPRSGEIELVAGFIVG